MMTHLLHPDHAQLLIIDIQEKFRPVLFNTQQVITKTRQMVLGCSWLQVPILVSQQYTKGLGETVSELKEVLPEATRYLEKTSFGCCDAPQALEHFIIPHRKQVLVCGIEAHICVNQTVTRLLEMDYQVFLIQDAIGSRHTHHQEIAFQKLHQLGALASCVEMALFELLRDASHPEFKAIQQLVRDTVTHEV